MGGNEMLGNWTKEEWTVWIIITVVVTIGCWLWWKYMQRGSTEKGAKERVGKKLAQYAKSRKFVVLNNVKLQAGAEQTVVDHLLVGTFGIVFVTTFHQGLVVYADPTAEQWRMRERNLNRSFDNPMLKATADMEILRKNFAKKDIYNIPMEPLIIFAEHTSTPEFVMSNGVIENMIIYKNLLSYLKKEKYNKDMGVDVQKVAAAIESFKLT